MLDPTKPNRDLLLLSPWFKQRVDVGLRMIADLGIKMAVYEGYRCPQRSDYLYEQGRTRPGKIVTKAKAWQSLHQYSLAVDLVGWDTKTWSWEIDYTKPIAVMQSLGFEAGATWGDKPHFQITGGLTWQECKAIMEQSGLPSVWHMVRERVEQREKQKPATGMA